MRPGIAMTSVTMSREVTGLLCSREEDRRGLVIQVPDTAGDRAGAAEDAAKRFRKGHPGGI